MCTVVPPCPVRHAAKAVKDLQQTHLSAVVIAVVLLVVAVVAVVVIVLMESKVVAGNL